MADLTDCTCGWGGVHDPDNQRCAAHGADPIDWKARHDDPAAALAALADDPAGRLSGHSGISVRWLRARVADLLADPAAVLADRDRRIKAEAWEECHEALMDWLRSSNDPTLDRTPPFPLNPYEREGGRADEA